MLPCSFDVQLAVRGAREGQFLHRPRPGLIRLPLIILSLVCTLSTTGQTLNKDSVLTEQAEPVEPEWAPCNPVQTALDIAGHDAAKAREVIQANRTIIIKPQCGWFALLKMVSDGDFEITKALIEAGVSPNSWKGVLSDTAFHCREDIAAYLLNHGANFRTPSGRGALAHSVELCANGRLTALLVRAGANVDLPGPTGETPLYWAAFYGNENAVYILVAAGANIHAMDHGGQTLLTMVRDLRQDRRPEHDRIYQFLKQMEELDKARSARRTRNKNR